jgi:hypothetical protein
LSGDEAIWGEPAGRGASYVGVDMSSERDFILELGFNRSGGGLGEPAGGKTWCWGNDELVEPE